RGGGHRHGRARRYHFRREPIHSTRLAKPDPRRSPADMGSPPDSPLIDASVYCRELETYLCRKNDGHLIRIAGPTFERVCGWAAMGVPLAVAFRGIDRYCERYYAKGPKRRPVRIDFCEADILELFDDWRRAVGVSASAAETDRPAHHDRG